MLNLTRRLVAIRRAKSALRRGSYEPVQAPEGCFAYLRKSGDERVFVALNFGAEELEGPLPVVPRASCSSPPSVAGKETGSGTACASRRARLD